RRRYMMGPAYGAGGRPPGGPPRPMSAGTGGPSGATLPGFRGERRSFEPAAHEAADNKKNLQRTEVVVLFVWREPTQSDLLLPQDEAPAEGAAEGAAASGAAPTGSAAPEAPAPARGVGGK